jgi:hypothetical protein
MNSDALATLIYLWTRDGKMQVGEETEKYIRDQLLCLDKADKRYSDPLRFEMALRLAKEIGV